MPRRLAPPSRSAYEVVDRGLVLLALVWQALWIIGDSRLWPTAQTSLAAMIAVWTVLASWLLLLIWRLTDLEVLRWPARWANVVALAAAAAAILIQAAGGTPPDWGATSGMVLLSVSIAGLVLGPASAIAWVVAVVAVESTVILGLAGRATALPLVSTDVLYPLYAVSVAAVMVSARLVLTHDARRADAAAAELLAVEQSRLTAEGVEAALSRQERLLHETVLNTLTAIVRGGITATGELQSRLHERCRECVDVLLQLGRRPETPGQPREQRLDHDLAHLLVELRAMGATVHLDCDDLRSLPPDAYDAVRTATREALSNVFRHADAANVSVTARVSEDTGAVEVTVRDDGRGFVTAAAEPGFGVRRAVIGGMAEVGGTASLRSAPGGGTTVVLAWQPSVPSQDPRLPSVAASAFAIPLLVSFGLFNLAALILTRDDVVDPLRNVMAFVLFLALAVLMAWASRRGRIPWWAVLTAVVGGAVVYQLQQSAVADQNGEWTDWASGAIIALFVLAAGAGPEWAWVVVLAGWLGIQGDILHELLASGTAIIVSAALFGRNLRRNEDIVLTAQSRQLQERTALSVAEEGSRRIRRRYATLRESEAVSLFRGIAAGELDPDTEQVRRWAALEERYIRTVMRVDPAVDAVHMLAVDLAGRAREAGVFLDVDVSADPAPRQVTVPGDVQALRWAIEHSVPGAVSRFSARAEGSEYVVRLLTPIPPERHPQALSLPLPGLELDPADPDMLWEIRAARGETDAREHLAAVDTAGDRR